MVISDRWKYLFVELPNTASTAIHTELCENYEGISILHKHALYSEFLRIANAEQKKYFVFSGIRNPLDVAVTLYVKYKTDHKGVFTDPEKLKSYARFPQAALRRYSFVTATDADFPTFLIKFYRFPYDNWSRLSHKKFDFIIRFENLLDDFTKALVLIGVKQKRPLPLINPTDGKAADFLSYYTPEIRDHARRTFGPFMKTWGYTFPPEWADDSVPWLSQVQYHILGLVRRHSEWGTSSLARLLRKLLDVSGL